MKNETCTALENAALQCRLRNRLRDLSPAELFDEMYLDPLTGAYTRRAFSQVVSKAVAIVDCDSLKWINDSAGHAAGDAMLHSLAELLINVFGQSNVFRLGGDEFGIVSDNAGALADSLDSLRRQHFANYSFGVGPNLTIADGCLSLDKAHRLANGLRSPRGVAPPNKALVG